jgi:hypothetical protein
LKIKLQNKIESNKNKISKQKEELENEAKTQENVLIQKKESFFY